MTSWLKTWRRRSILRCLILMSGLESFAEESGAARRPAGRRTPTRGKDGRRPESGSRLGRLTRRSLRRFDQYTLEVLNPGTPYGRSDG